MPISTVVWSYYMRLEEGSIMGEGDPMREDGKHRSWKYQLIDSSYRRCMVLWWTSALDLGGLEIVRWRGTLENFPITLENVFKATRYVLLRDFSWSWLNGFLMLQPTMQQ